MNEPLLTINDIKTQFFTKRGIIPAVDGVSIEIPKGKIVGLVGESGCGKTMTAMSIMGLVQRPGKVVSGSIIFNGEDLLTFNEYEMRNIRGNKISMIFQEPMTSLNPVYTVGRQVKEALIIHHKIKGSKAKKNVIEMFKKIGIPEAEKRYYAYPHQLSGGLRQRVMIGMAMICSPQLLIADEPTTALDVTIEAQILHLMKELSKKNETSILMITHNFGIVAELCDFVYVMYAGKVMEYAEIFELFENTKHPYTKFLINAVPKPDPKLRKEDKEILTGEIPSPLNPPSGCRFHTRCPYAYDLCKKVEPKMQNYHGRMVACHNVLR